MRAKSFYWAIAILTAGLPASAKSPGATHCYKKVCHRVQTAAETRGQIGVEKLVRASFYDHCKLDAGNPCSLTSSGEQLRADLPDNAASPIYPDGTVLQLTNPRNGAKAEVRINNAGPYAQGRILDVSRAAAEQLGFTDVGVTDLLSTIVAAPP